MLGISSLERCHVWVTFQVLDAWLAPVSRFLLACSSLQALLLLEDVTLRQVLRVCIKKTGQTMKRCSTTVYQDTSLPLPAADAATERRC